MGTHGRAFGTAGSISGPRAVDPPETVVLPPLTLFPSKPRLSLPPGPAATASTSPGPREAPEGWGISAGGRWFKYRRRAAQGSSQTGMGDDMTVSPFLFTNSIDPRGPVPEVLSAQGNKGTVPGPMLLCPHPGQAGLRGRKKRWSPLLGPGAHSSCRSRDGLRVPQTRDGRDLVRHIQSLFSDKEALCFFGGPQQRATTVLSEAWPRSPPGFGFYHPPSRPPGEQKDLAAT